MGKKYPPSLQISSPRSDVVLMSVRKWHRRLYCYFSTTARNWNPLAQHFPSTATSRPSHSSISPFALIDTVDQLNAAILFLHWSWWTNYVSWKDQSRLMHVVKTSPRFLPQFFFLKSGVEAKRYRGHFFWRHLLFGRKSAARKTYQATTKLMSKANASLLWTTF